MPRLNLDLDRKVFERFKKNCLEAGRSMSDTVRQLIGDYNHAVEYEKYVEQVINGKQRDS